MPDSPKPGTAPRRARTALRGAVRLNTPTRKATRRNAWESDAKQVYRQLVAKSFAAMNPPPRVLVLFPSWDALDARTIRPLLPGVKFICVEEDSTVSVNIPNDWLAEPIHFMKFSRAVNVMKEKPDGAWLDFTSPLGSHLGSIQSFIKKFVNGPETFVLHVTVMKDNSLDRSFLPEGFEGKKVLSEDYKNDLSDMNHRVWHIRKLEKNPEISEVKQQDS